MGRPGNEKEETLALVAGPRNWQVAIRDLRLVTGAGMRIRGVTARVKTGNKLWGNHTSVQAKKSRLCWQM